MSMWTAPSDRDYHDQFNPEPEENDEPEVDADWVSLLAAEP